MNTDAPIVIVGTGLSGYSLAKEIRKQDKDTPIVMITADDGYSYSKPMLSTGFTKGKEADELAKKENKSDLIAGVDLEYQSNEVVNILIDLAQRETMNESAVFARKLVTELAKVRKMLRNTHRFAGFAVLKAPDIPSVLIELGYLSNRTDERMLRDAKQRRRIATAMTRAIRLYFDRQQALNKP